MLLVTNVKVILLNYPKFNLMKSCKLETGMGTKRMFDIKLN